MRVDAYVDIPNQVPNCFTIPISCPTCKFPFLIATLNSAGLPDKNGNINTYSSCDIMCGRDNFCSSWGSYSDKDAWEWEKDASAIRNAVAEVTKFKVKPKRRVKSFLKGRL